MLPRMSARPLARTGLARKLLSRAGKPARICATRQGAALDHTTLERMIRTGKLSTVEVLQQTPVDRLEEAMAILSRHRAAKDICQALMERIAKAPLDDFNALKRLYFQHCVDRPGKAGAE